MRKAIQGVRLLTRMQQDGAGETVFTCSADDFKAMLEIVNDAARAYKGVIPYVC